MVVAQVLKPTGAQASLEYAIYFHDKTSDKRLSPWHDLPLKPQGHSYGEYTFVCEIPMGCVRIVGTCGRVAHQLWWSAVNVEK